MKSFCVYKHTCPNGKAYIGITCQKPKRRWRNGEGYTRSPSNPHFKRAIEKYGWDNIKHDILHDGLDEQTAKKAEIELIAHYKTQDYKHGYNITSGGDGIRGYKHTEEFRDKQRMAWTGSKINLGRKHTEEARRNMSLSHMGNKNALGKKRSEDAIRRAAEKAMKPVIMICDGTEIARYVSVLSASKDIGIHPSCISRVCNGERKQAGGYNWKYV